MQFGFTTSFSCPKDRIDPDFYRAAKEAGFDFLELTAVMIDSISEDERKRLVECLKTIGIESTGLSSLFPARIRFFESSGEEIEEYLDGMFAKVKDLGVKTIGFGSGKSRCLPENMSRDEGMEIFMERVRKHMIPYLEKYGYDMVIEPFNPVECNFILTVAEAAEAIQKIGSGLIGVLPDTLHMIGSKDDPALIADEIGLVRNIHVSEPDRIMPVKRYSPECLTYLLAFAAAGYDGAVCFETKCADLRDLRPALELLRSTIGGKA